MTDRAELREIAGQARRLLRRMQIKGIAAVPGTGRASTKPVLSLPKGSARTGPSVTLSPSKGKKQAQLGPVRQQALGCRLCKLCQGRSRVVFGDGSLDAPVVFVGEGPGRDEDLQGLPFVGAAGQLLNRIIQAMGMTRPQVYICNVVKCRPPNNRPPEPDEIAACMPYLEQQLAVIRPKVICALGKTAAAALLETEAPMSALRGRLFERKGIPLVVTYHPAYLLRNPAAKKDVWEDMKKVLAILKSEL